MRSWFILFFCGALGAATLPAAGLAEELASDDAVDISIVYPQEKTADGRSPLEIILGKIQRQFGWSFIFDSRVLKGKAIKPIHDSAELTKTLTERLAETGLQLNRVSNDTFVITAATDADYIKEKEPRGAAKPFHDIIIVTSSPAVKKAPISSGNIFELDERYLDYFNTASADRAVFDLPQTLASFTPTNTVFFGPVAGMSLADLRGLGPNRTMVLVNGRPVSPTVGGIGSVLGVDLKRFATPFLERVELQTTPASARFGNGASIGAVNFVLRSDFVGSQAGGGYGISEIGDQENISLHFLGGTNILGDVGNVTAGAYFAKNSSLIGADRPTTSDSYDFGLNGIKSSAPDAEFLPGFGQSFITEKGRILGVILQDGTFSSFPNNESFIPNSDGTISPFIRSVDQFYNALAETTTLPNLEQFMGYVSGSAQASTSLRLFAQVEAGLIMTDLQLAPTPGIRSRGLDLTIGSAAAIPIDNQTLPQPVLDLVQNAFGGDAQSVIFERRFVELGPRRDTIDRYFLDLTLGAEFSRNSTELYSLTYSFGKTRAIWEIQNRVNGDNLATALQPDICNTTADCAPIDFFTPSGVSTATQDFIRAPSSKAKNIFERHQISILADKKIPGILPDDIAIRMGADVRYLRLKKTVESNLDFVIVGVDRINSAEGSIVEYDFSGGINLPLLRSPDWLGTFDVSADFRLTKSSVYNTITNLEAAVTWSPHSALEFSAHRHLGHRAPNVVELFTANLSQAIPVFDPCDVRFESAPPIIIENCMSATPFGVGSGFTRNTTLTTRTIFGNPELEAEDVKFFGASATIRPTEIITGIPGQMDISAMWLSYRIDDRIDLADNTLFACYTSVNFSDDACGINPLTGNRRIIRDPTSRQVIAIEALARNSGTSIWRGLDFEANYVLEPRTFSLFDRFWLRGFHSYTHRVFFINQAGEVLRADGLVDYPRHQTNISAGIDRDRFGLAVLFKRRGRVLSANSDIPEARIPAISYLDAHIRFDLSINTYVQFGAENLFDRDPPIAPFVLLANTPANFYDIIGRRYLLSTRVNF